MKIIAEAILIAVAAGAVGCGMVARAMWKAMWEDMNPKPPSKEEWKEQGAMIWPCGKE